MRKAFTLILTKIKYLRIEFLMKFLYLLVYHVLPLTTNNSSKISHIFIFFSVHISLKNYIKKITKKCISFEKYSKIPKHQKFVSKSQKY